MKGYSNTVIKVIVACLIIFFSYLRHSYLINPNFEQTSWLIPVYDKAFFDGIASFKSMMVFFVIFGFMNWMFGVFFVKKGKKIILYLYMALVFLSAFMFGLYKLTNAGMLFTAGSIVKNFILSPVYMLTVYIWFTKVDRKVE